MFSNETYSSRRDNLMKNLGEGVIILPSYPERILSNDTYHKFRQQNEIIYYSGFPEPETTVVIENQGKDILYHLFVRKRDPLRETWNGIRYGLEGAKKKFNPDFVYESNELEKQLFEILKKYENVFLQSGENSTTDDIVFSVIKKAINATDRNGKGPINIKNPIDVFHKIRAIKGKEEISICEKSAKISSNAMTNAMANTRPGMNEYQIEALLEFEFRNQGAQRPAYNSICGNGVNGTILHYEDNNQELIDGNLLLVDAGCQYQDYCADITRTWPVNGKFSDAQRKIYELVLSIQKECIEMIKPDIKFQDISNHAIKLITRGLLKIGLLEGVLEDLIKDEKYKRFYMHGLGHWVGMDVHDTGRFNIKEEKLIPGLYVTVEPGIYIPDDEDIPLKFRGIGVRIEDDVLVTATGYEILTKDVIKEIDQIEEIVGSKVTL
ncbi:MAG: Xaa-Pro aminopeptidase [Candidatus Heimdallarchaeota archaeon LC_2]|nr:MAG: Xaa-Pro aminopeptidase [Candidatus Heimdallarchaeota archaeon LC_2]